MLITSQAQAQDKSKEPAQKPKAEAPAAPGKIAFKDQRDKVSYSIGLNIGKSMKSQGVDVDFETMLKGLKDGASGATPSLTEDEIQVVMTAFQQEMMAKQSEKGNKAKKEGEDFLAANKKKEGIKTTESGLQYKVIKQGTGPKPKPSDTVAAQYRGTFIDGSEFDSSAKHGGKPVEFPVTGVIPGWTEALQLMTVGSKWQLFIPSDLAYGPTGSPPAIPGGSTLIFDIELVSIVKEKGGLDLK